MYAIRYALAAVLWCAVVPQSLAEFINAEDIVIQLNIPDSYIYNLHADVIEDANHPEANVITSTNHTITKRVVESLSGRKGTPRAWGTSWNIYYQHQILFTPNLSNGTPKTLVLPNLTAGAPFSSLTPSSNGNRYTVYPTNVDGIGVAFRFAAALFNWADGYLSNTPRIFNSGELTAAQSIVYPQQPAIGGYPVYVVAQAVLVKTRRSQFLTYTPQTQHITATLGTFTIIGKEFNGWGYDLDTNSAINIQLKINADIILQPQTCTFTPATTTVTLPLVPTANFNPTEQDNLLPSVPFEFGVDCGSNNAIKVRAAIQDVTNHQNTSSILENTGSAQNVGVQILYDNNPVTLSALNAAYHMPDPYNGSKLDAVNNQFKFTARYKKIDPNTDVSAGSVRAQAKIYFYYQ